ncbi:hypothetical protein JMJ77_0002868 [Colletotrichum scovillei]|uniref:Uncharacterized protein n=1 Tax=Colletotrichum scovillei TaxID=1209932 RepID=A0A9P7QWX7_9PEZI|nr:hypothetical protein JMJ78_0006078 [Colletotrichum scovillei]KAG7043158.1 hypothetical protein JMJ77_0002868 [Colletotrichum scovillei]KAG7062606.1 hypothetical protein JMJ76_0009453 [Colletotrichum scovillei]
MPVKDFLSRSPRNNRPHSMNGASICQCSFCSVRFIDSCQSWIEIVARNRMSCNFRTFLVQMKVYESFGWGVS